MTTLASPVDAKWWPYFESVAGSARVKRSAPTHEEVTPPTDEVPEHCAVVVWRDQHLFAVCRGKLFCLRLEAAGDNPITGWTCAQVQGTGPTAVLAAATLFGAKLIIHGGLESSEMTGAMHMTSLNPYERRWVKVYQQHTAEETALPTPVCQHTLSLWKAKRKLILHGGAATLSPKLELTDQTWLFDLDTQVWTELPRSGTGRAGHTAAVLHGSMIVAGGIEECGALSWLVSVFILESKVWRVITKPESPLFQDMLLSPMCIDIPGKAVWWSGGAKLDLSNISTKTAWRLCSTATLPRIEAKCPWAASAASGIIYYVVDNCLWLFHRGTWETVTLQHNHNICDEADDVPEELVQVQSPLTPSRPKALPQQQPTTPKEKEPLHFLPVGYSGPQAAPPLLPRPLTLPARQRTGPRLSTPPLDWAKEASVIKTVLKTSRTKRVHMQKGSSTVEKEIAANLSGCSPKAVASIMQLKADAHVLDLSSMKLTSADYFLIYIALRRHPSIQKVDCSNVSKVDDISARAVVGTLTENPRITKWLFDNVEFESVSSKRAILAHTQGNMHVESGRLHGQHSGVIQTRRYRALQQERRRREGQFARVRERVLQELSGEQERLSIEQSEGRLRLRLAKDAACEILAEQQRKDKLLIALLQAHSEAQAQSRLNFTDDESDVRSEAEKLFMQDYRQMCQDELTERRALEEVLAERAKVHRAEREAISIKEKDERSYVKDDHDKGLKALRVEMASVIQKQRELERLIRQQIEEEERRKRDEETRRRQEAEKKKRLEAEAEMKRCAQVSELSWREITSREKVETAATRELNHLKTDEWDVMYKHALHQQLIGNAERELHKLESEPPTFSLSDTTSHAIYVCSGASTVVNRPLAGVSVVTNVPVPEHMHAGVIYPHNTETLQDIIVRRSEVEAAVVLLYILPQELTAEGAASIQLSMDTPCASVLRNAFSVEGGAVYQGGRSVASFTHFSPTNLEAVRQRVDKLAGAPTQGEGAKFFTDEATARLGVCLEVDATLTDTLFSELFALLSIVLPYGTGGDGTTLSIHIESTLRFSKMAAFSPPCKQSLTFTRTNPPMFLADCQQRTYQEGSGKMKLFNGASLPPNSDNEPQHPVIHVIIHVEGLGLQDYLTCASTVKKKESIVATAPAFSGMKVTEHGWLMQRSDKAGEGDAVPATPDHSTTVVKVANNAKDIRHFFKNLAFINTSNDPEETERVFTIALRFASDDDRDTDSDTSCPVVLGRIRVNMIASDDPSVVDFGMVSCWRQVAKDVPLQLQGHLPQQEPIAFAQFGCITDVDTEEFSAGFLRFSLAPGHHKTDSLQFQSSEDSKVTFKGGKYVYYADETEAFACYESNASSLDVSFCANAAITKADALFRCVALSIAESAKPAKEVRCVTVNCEFLIGTFPVHNSCHVKVSPPLLHAPASSCTSCIKEDAGPVPLCTRFDILEQDDGFDGGFILVSVVEGASIHDLPYISEKGDVRLGPCTKHTTEDEAPKQHEVLASILAEEDDEDVDEAEPDGADDKDDSVQETKCEKRDKVELKDLVRKHIKPEARKRLEQRRHIVRTINLSITQFKDMIQEEESCTLFDKQQHAARLSESRPVFVGSEEIGLMTHFPEGMLVKFKTGKKVKRLLQGDVPSTTTTRKESCEVKRKDVLQVLRAITFQNTSKTTKIHRKVLQVTLHDGLGHASHTLHEVNIEDVDDATEIRRLSPDMRILHQGTRWEANGFLPLDDYTLYDPDTVVFNGGYVNIALVNPKRQDRLSVQTLEQQKQSFEQYSALLHDTNHPDLHRLKGTRRFGAVSDEAKRRFFDVDGANILHNGVPFGTIAEDSGGVLLVELAAMPAAFADEEYIKVSALAAEQKVDAGVITLGLVEDFLSCVAFRTKKCQKPQISTLMLKIGAEEGLPGKRRIQLQISPPFLHATHSKELEYTRGGDAIPLIENYRMTTDHCFKDGFFAVKLLQKEGPEKVFLRTETAQFVQKQKSLFYRSEFVGEVTEDVSDSSHELRVTFNWASVATAEVLNQLFTTFYYESLTEPSDTVGLREVEITMTESDPAAGCVFTLPVFNTIPSLAFDVSVGNVPTYRHCTAPVLPLGAFGLAPKLLENVSVLHSGSWVECTIQERKQQGESVCVHSNVFKDDSEVLKYLSTAHPSVASYEDLGKANGFRAVFHATTHTAVQDFVRDICYHNYTSTCPSTVTLHLKLKGTGSLGVYSSSVVVPCVPPALCVPGSASLQHSKTFAESLQMVDVDGGVPGLGETFVLQVTVVGGNGVYVFHEEDAPQVAQARRQSLTRHKGSVSNAQDAGLPSNLELLVTHSNFSERACGVVLRGLPGVGQKRETSAGPRGGRSGGSGGNSGQPLGTLHVSLWNKDLSVCCHTSYVKITN